MDLAQNIFIIVLIVGVIVLYLKYSYDEKFDELNIILDKKCPKCGKGISDYTDIKNGGCSGTSTINVECPCGYSGSFSHTGGSCSS